MKRLAAFILLAALAAGCSTYNVGTTGGHTTVAVQTTCWKFLNCLPIASGDPETPNVFLCDWFTNNATVERNLVAIDFVMRKVPATRCENLVSRYEDTQVVPFLLKRTACHTSAELRP